MTKQIEIKILADVHVDEDLEFSEAELTEALNQYFKDLRHELFILEFITGYFSVDVNEVEIIEHDNI